MAKKTVEYGKWRVTFDSRTFPYEKKNTDTGLLFSGEKFSLLISPHLVLVHERSTSKEVGSVSDEHADTFSKRVLSVNKTIKFANIIVTRVKS